MLLQVRENGSIDEHRRNEGTRTPAAAVGTSRHGRRRGCSSHRRCCSRTALVSASRQRGGWHWLDMYVRAGWWRGRRRLQLRERLHLSEGESGSRCRGARRRMDVSSTSASARTKATSVRREGRRVARMQGGDTSG